MTTRPSHGSYIFSSALVGWLGTSAEIGGWVQEAMGAEREVLQWQKYEDTSTGYWLTYAPFTVRYINMGVWVHDFVCHARGEEKRARGGTYRPPNNASIFVHNLKNGGFAAAWELAQPNVKYDHARCVRDMNHLPIARPNLASSGGHGKRGNKRGQRGAGGG